MADYGSSGGALVPSGEPTSFGGPPPRPGGNYRSARDRGADIGAGGDRRVPIGARRVAAGGRARGGQDGAVAGGGAAGVDAGAVVPAGRGRDVLGVCRSGGSRRRSG